MAGNPKDRILEATFRVVARMTISGTRVPAIAKQAGVSQGILFYYFDTKEKLLLSLLDWLLDAFREYRGISSGQRIEAPDPRSPAKVKAAFLKYLRMLIEVEPEMTRVFYDFWVQAAGGTGPFENTLKEQFRIYRGDVAQMLSAKRCEGVPSNVLSGIVVSLFEGAALQLTLDRDSFGLDEYLDSISTLIDDIIEL